MLWWVLPSLPNTSAAAALNRCSRRRPRSWNSHTICENRSSVSDVGRAKNVPFAAFDVDLEDEVPDAAVRERANRVRERDFVGARFLADDLERKKLQKPMLGRRPFDREVELVKLDAPARQVGVPGIVVENSHRQTAFDIRQIVEHHIAAVADAAEPALLEPFHGHGLDEPEGVDDLALIGGRRRDDQLVPQQLFVAGEQLSDALHPAVEHVDARRQGSLAKLVPRVRGRGHEFRSL